MDTGRHSSEYRRNRTSLCLQEALSVISKDEDLQGAKLNESLIRRALWAKNYDVQAAIKVLLAYAKWNYKTLGSLSARLSISHVHAFLLTGILQAPPAMVDVEGFPCMYMRPNIYQPEAIPYDHVINALVYLLSYLTSSDEKAGKYGITFVCDMKGWGWSNYGIGYASQFFSILSKRFPIRIHRFILVNSPSIFPIVWKMIKTMMSEELASRFTFVTDDAIDRLIDKKLLPAELGGTAAPMDVLRFIKERYVQEGAVYRPIDISMMKWTGVTKLAPVPEALEEAI